MKKGILYLVFTVVIFCETTVVASFNTLKLGENKKDYESLSEIISKFDLIGLQEVIKEAPLKKIVSIIEEQTGLDWDYHISEYPVGSSSYKEYYAFIWRKNKVTNLGSCSYYKEKESHDFLREPYSCIFKIGEFDFRYIIAHSVYGDLKYERIKEASKYNDVYDYYKMKDSEKDIILAGDFNLTAYDKGFQSLFKNDDEIFYVLDPDRYKTTIGDTELVNSYDNFFVSYKKTKEYTGRYGAYNFASKKGYKTSRKTISDHIPIYIEINIDKDDD